MALCYGVQPKDPLLHSIYNAAVSDPVYQSIVTAIKRGKSVAKLQKGHPGKNDKSVWDKISVLDDAILVIDATQIVVPIEKYYSRKTKLCLRWLAGLVVSDALDAKMLAGQNITGAA
jgi:hypothetical protein